MTIASLIYNAAAVLCMAAVAGWVLVRLCNAWTRPDDALASLLRLGYHLIYLAQSGQMALAHYRHAQDINRAKLADAMLPMRFAEAPAEGRE